MIPEDELWQMYWGEEMTMLQIAKEVGVCEGSIYYWMQKYGIESRTHSEAGLIGTRMLSKEDLEYMYWSSRMSQSEIAEEVGVGQIVVSRWMQKYGIKVRTNSESLVGRFTGENAGNWNGGTSFEPYCSRFDNDFKESVRRRDDYTCQLCGYEQKINGRRLSVHHIHYDKSNCYPDVVALCHSCHTKTTSGDRNYWEAYFENQLLERGLLGLSIL